MNSFAELTLEPSNAPPRRDPAPPLRACVAIASPELAEGEKYPSPRDSRADGF